MDARSGSLVFRRPIGLPETQAGAEEAERRCTGTRPENRRGHADPAARRRRSRRFASSRDLSRDVADQEQTVVGRCEGDGRCACTSCRASAICARSSHVRGDRGPQARAREQDGRSDARDKTRDDGFGAQAVGQDDQQLPDVLRRMLVVARKRGLIATCRRSSGCKVPRAGVRLPRLRGSGAPGRGGGRGLAHDGPGGAADRDAHRRADRAALAGRRSGRGPDHRSPERGEREDRDAEVGQAARDPARRGRRRRAQGAPSPPWSARVLHDGWRDAEVHASCAIRCGARARRRGFAGPAGTSSATRSRVTS